MKFTETVISKQVQYDRDTGTPIIYEYVEVLYEDGQKKNYKRLQGTPIDGGEDDFEAAFGWGKTPAAPPPKPIVVKDAWEDYLSERENEENISTPSDPN